MNINRKFFYSLPIMIILFSGCYSGKVYDSGVLRFEHFDAGIAELARDDQGVRYSVIDEKVCCMAATQRGVQYSNTLNGAILKVNFPSSALFLCYPLQYIDLTSEARLFGLGSPKADFRVSILWGFVSLGKNWNVAWLNGFWWGKNDPLLSSAPYYN